MGLSTERECTIMSRHHQVRARHLLPEKGRRQVDRIQGAEFRRRRLRRPPRATARTRRRTQSSMRLAFFEEQLHDVDVQFCRLGQPHPIRRWRFRSTPPMMV